MFSTNNIYAHCFLNPNVKMTPYILYNERPKTNEITSKDQRCENERVPDKLNRIYLSNVEGYLVEKTVHDMIIYITFTFVIGLTLFSLFYLLDDYPPFT